MFFLAWSLREADGNCEDELDFASSHFSELMKSATSPDLGRLSPDLLSAIFSRSSLKHESEDSL
jgi:hypothetical protein